MPSEPPTGAPDALEPAGPPPSTADPDGVPPREPSSSDARISSDAVTDSTGPGAATSEGGAPSRDRTGTSETGWPVALEAAVAQMVSDFGMEAAADPARVKGILSDLSGTNARRWRTQIAAAAAAASEGIPAALADPHGDRSALASRLSDVGVTPVMAAGAVGAWDRALNPTTAAPRTATVAPELVAGSTRLPPEEAEAAPGPPVEPAKGRSRRPLVLASAMAAVLLGVGGVAWARSANDTMAVHTAEVVAAAKTTVVTTAPPTTPSTAPETTVVATEPPTPPSTAPETVPPEAAPPVTRPPATTTTTKAPVTKAAPKTTKSAPPVIPKADPPSQPTGPSAPKTPTDPTPIDPPPAPAADPIVANDDSFAWTPQWDGTAFYQAKLTVLNNDTGPYDHIQAIAVPQYGNLVWDSATNAFYYQPTYYGPYTESFTYYLYNSQGKASATATVWLTVYGS